jgi:hypothetical protein
MGFGYAGTFLIIFLTHPGVIIPTMSSATSLLPAEAAAAVPSEGFPPLMSALWQVFWAWFLNLLGSKNDATAYTMYTLYLIFLGIYMYVFLGSRIQKGV